MCMTSTKMASLLIILSFQRQESVYSFPFSSRKAAIHGLVKKDYVHHDHLALSRLPKRQILSENIFTHSQSSKYSTQLQALFDEDEQELKRLQEKSRIQLLSDRRKTIRKFLKAAENTRNFRLQNGYIPDMDPETNKPIQSDAKSAVTLTAFVIAAGAVALRVGGRAALISALGLDFATENQELREGLDSVLEYASNIDTSLEVALFLLAWTAVKVLCFDAGGVILALASGILFGGVWQGAVVSAFAATVGSSVAFGMAKLDTPVRKKALEVVEEYPSLRGIEKVVAKDGLKTILTLRLAPVLPIPIGFYNYVYGVTNVPYLDFAGGIFLGSLKPYLLDSYLGIFGKQIVDGTAATGDSGSLQDILLLVALGVSVLIGVFASQLANETWESINEEVEREKAEQQDDEGKSDGVLREFMGISMPQWVIGFQLSLKTAENRINTMIEQEYHAKCWNGTLDDQPFMKRSSVEMNDPALLPESPEIIGAGKGFDIASSLCDGLVLAPALFAAFFKYADPLYDEEEQSSISQENLPSGSEGMSHDTASFSKLSFSPALSETFTESASENSEYSTNVEESSKNLTNIGAVFVNDLLTALERLKLDLLSELDKA